MPPSAVMNPLQHIKSAHTRFDFTFGNELKAYDFKPTCAKGCHACCSEAIYVLADEAKLVLKSIPPEELPGVVERTRVWVERAEATGMLKVNTPHVFAYRQAKLLCPLLKDGLCLVYKDRPLGCRGHLAIDDPALCHDDHKRLEQRFVNGYVFINQARDTMVKGSKRPVVGDHLGVFLARKLLGIETSSKSELVLE